MVSYKKIKLGDFEGEALEGVSEEKLKEFLTWPQCAQSWKLIRRVSSHGTYTYQFQDDLGLGKRDYFIKLYHKREKFQVAWKKLKSRKGLKKPWRYLKAMLRFLLEGVPVKVGFEKGKLLHEKNIPTALPVAYLCKKGLVSAFGFIITEKIPNLVADNLAEYLKQRKKEISQVHYLKEKRALIQVVAELVSKLMQMNFFLPDLRVSNLLVEPLAEGKFKLWVIDLVEAEEHPPREEKMLYHLIANPYYAQLFTGTDKIRFLKWYLKFSGQQRHWRELCDEVIPLLKSWWKKWYEKYEPKSK